MPAAHKQLNVDLHDALIRIGQTSKLIQTMVWCQPHFVLMLRLQGYLFVRPC